MLSGAAAKSRRERNSVICAHAKPQVPSHKCPLVSCALLLLLLLLLGARPQQQQRLVRAVRLADQARSNSSAREHVHSSELSFEFLGLSRLPELEPFCSLERRNLNSVSFAHNRIEQLAARGLACIGGRLKLLDLSHNAISMISADAFHHLRQLQVLLLNANQIESIPSAALEPLAALRHLNLAQNRVATVGAQVAPNLSQLISLDLRANPLRRVHARAFVGLARLKTLSVCARPEFRRPHTASPLDAKVLTSRPPTTRRARRPRARRPQWTRLETGSILSHAELEHWPWPLAGLGALSFLHLDAALGRLNESEWARAELDCALAPRLAQVSLRANQLERVPKFASNCAELQSLDLSRNKLTGAQLDAAPFAELANLLDLQLAHNALERLGARAFAGLARLEALELGANRLEAVRADSMRPLEALIELGVAGNGALAELQLGERAEKQLQVLRAHSCPKLRNVPLLSRARHLSLTYAYHCCDYYRNSHWRAKQARPDELEDEHDDDDDDDDEAAGSGRQASQRPIGELLVWPRRADYKRESGANNWLEARRDELATSERDYSPRSWWSAANSKAPRVIDGQRAPAPVCWPRPGPLQPCNDLFDSWWLRAGVWLVFAGAFAGNLLVIVVLGSARATNPSSALANLMWLGASRSRRHIDVPRFLVLNLAFADLLMALYLCLLAQADLRTWGHFRAHALAWQHSFGCKLAAFLAVLSSELSVFILAIITLERNYAITNAVHLNRRLSLQKAVLIMLLGYSFALCMALAPLNGVSDYRKFAVCLPLDFATSKWAGHYLLTLISINAASFVMLLACYLRMYCAIRGSQAWNSNDLKIAKRMSVLILADFLCWMPIILVACFALAGHLLVGARGLKVLTVFVLPLNSLLNPFLYAITTKKFRRDLEHLRRRLAKLVWAHKQALAATAGRGGPEQVAGHAERAGRHELQAERADLEQQQQQRRRRALRRPDTGAVSPAKSVNRSLRCHRGQAPKRQEAQWNWNTTANRPSGVCCSCGRLAARQSLAGARPAVTKHQVAVQVKLSSASSCGAISARLAAAPSERASSFAGPRIVLDSVCEPTLEIALAPLKASLACRPLITGANNSSLSNSNSPPRLGPLTGSGSSDVRPSGPPASSLLDRPASVLHQLKPEVALGASERPRRHLASCQAILCGCSASRQALGPRDSSGAQRRCTNADEPMQDAPEVRCASACAYRWPVSGQVSGASSLRAKTSAQPEARGKPSSSIGGTMSRSISRLLFRPLARAWSSIQSNSLNSVAAQQARQPAVVASRAAQDCKKRACCSCNSASSRSDEVLAKGACKKCQLESVNCDLLAKNKQAKLVLYDSHLADNSPSSWRSAKQARHRRMSRSCDQLYSNTNTHTTTLVLAGSDPSSSNESHNSPIRKFELASNKAQNFGLSGAEATASSEQDDGEQCTLLAATSHGRQVALASHGLARETARQVSERDRGERQDGRQGLRCGARCRSWSPALLAKLDDCVQQIKDKLQQRMGSQADAPEQANCAICRREELRYVSENSSSNQSEDGRAGPSTGELLEPRFAKAPDEQADEQMRQNSRDKQLDERDEFDERALVEWRSRWRNRDNFVLVDNPIAVDTAWPDHRSRRLSGQRLQHQSSGASESFSVKTTATTSTTFDSLEAAPLDHRDNTSLAAPRRARAGEPGREAAASDLVALEEHHSR